MFGQAYNLLAKVNLTVMFTVEVAGTVKAQREEADSETGEVKPLGTSGSTNVFMDFKLSVYVNHRISRVNKRIADFDNNRAKTKEEGGDEGSKTWVLGQPHGQALIEFLAPGFGTVRLQLM